MKSISYLGNASFEECEFEMEQSMVREQLSGRVLSDAEVLCDAEKRTEVLQCLVTVLYRMMFVNYDMTIINTFHWCIFNLLIK